MLFSAFLQNFLHFRMNKWELNIDKTKYFAFVRRHVRTNITELNFLSADDVWVKQLTKTRLLGIESLSVIIPKQWTSLSLILNNTPHVYQSKDSWLDVMYEKGHSCWQNNLWWATVAKWCRGSYIHIHQEGPHNGRHWHKDHWHTTHGFHRSFQYIPPNKNT